MNKPKSPKPISLSNTMVFNLWTGRFAVKLLYGFFLIFTLMEDAGERV